MNRSVPGLTDVQHITLIHNTALGDFVLAFHVACAVRDLYPGAQLHCVTKSSHGRLVEQLGLAQGCSNIDGPEFLPLFAADGQKIADAPGPLSETDLILNCTGPAGGLVARRLADMTDAASYSIDPLAAPDDTRHITEQWAEHLISAGLDPVTIRPIQTRDMPADRLKARAKLQRHSPTAGEPIVLVHPGSGGVDKSWGIEHFQNVVMALKAESVQPVWMLGPVEQDRWPAKRISELSVLAPVIAAEELPAAAELAAAADAYLGNDAGFTHVAAMLGTATVVLFGPTPASVWEPIGRNVRVLAGSGLTPNPFAGIAARNVADAVLAALAEPPISA